MRFPTMTSYKGKPRKPKIIRQEMRELDRSAVSSKQWIEKNPDDEIVKILVDQYKLRKTHLSQELKDSYKAHRKHSILYAVKTKFGVEIQNLSELLSTFGNVINSTLKKLPNTQEVDSLNLYFDTVVESSFGVLMSTDWDSELIGTSIERTFNRFFDILDTLENDPEIDDDILMSDFLIDKTLLSKYRTFYRGISSYNQSIHISWEGHAIQNRSFNIDPKMATNAFKKLIEFDQPISDDFEVTGSIQGISLINKSLQFIPHKREGAMIKLYYDESLNDQIKPLLGEVATIKYKVSVEYDAAKDKTKTKKSLLKIITPE